MRVTYIAQSVVGRWIGMIDRETVIRHFQDAIEASGNNNKWRFVRLDIIEDAIELLKEQEPRLFKLDDVSAWIRQKPLDREPIYVEVKDLFGAWMVDEIASYLPETDLSGELYGKTWRVWSAKPTEEQRKEAKWND